MIEHVMRVIMSLSDRIVVNLGSKLAEGPPQAIANDPHVHFAEIRRRGPMKLRALAGLAALAAGSNSDAECSTDRASISFG